MAIPSGTVLEAQLHCLSDDGLVVMTAQRWCDPKAPTDRPRSWLRSIRNGEVAAEHRFTGASQHQEMREFWVQLVDWFTPAGLTEDQMWAKLLELTGIQQTRCQGKDCAGAMPAGWPICPDCGRDSRRVAAGSLSGVHRRGIIVVRQPPTSAR